MPLRMMMIMSMLVTVLAWCANAAAQQAQPPATQPPATAPAEGPATAPAADRAAPDPTSPKGTLKLLSDAMERGDEQAMSRFMMAEGPTEQKMVTAQISQARAFAQFRQALVATFGQQALDDLIGRAPTPAQRDAVFDAAPEKIVGDRATITVEQDVYELKRINGQWRLSLAGMAKSIEPAVLEESLKEMKLRSEVMSELADEIAQGQYQNTDEVGQALQGKMMAALMREAAASTQPATQPEK